MDYESVFRQDQAQIEAFLGKYLENSPQYARLQEAMRYSLLAGGKRIRPVLVLEACRICGGEVEKALPFACAVEMIHTYSLIHDDLPAMDNDDLRRGRPTNHKEFGEAAAILAGDALLTEAFFALSQAELPPDRIVQAVACLSAQAGHLGMVGGQALDMEEKKRTVPELEQLQSLKTGALLQAAAELGCIAAGGTPQQRQGLRVYAEKLGRAFQIRDDMLDVMGEQAQLGKPIGSDAELGKSTFAALLGLEACAGLVEELTAQAAQALAPFEARGFLVWLAQQLAQRSF
ncbi:MAG: polyprenyl synthetase family protein [Oscillospiraceae bacterium]|jgi:geranylgeranyl diphosphate synthase type II|nr:polyprenyl synthetase family protein [Oscillospiraceae bacterium]MCI9581777.1 polyprenyl synthetase family protein [Oscillospiraceae bacterium]